MADTPVNPYPDEKDTTDYQISPRAGWIVALVFFPFVFAFPLWHHFQLAISGKWGESPAAQLIGWRPADGPLLERLHSVEKSTDKAAYATAIRQTTQSLLVDHAGEGNRKVVLGQGDWLYYQPELTALRGWGPVHREPFSVMKDPSVAKLRMARDVVLEFAAQLKERGLPLLLVPVPVKPMIYPEHLSSAKFTRPVYHRDQLELYDQLRKAGIDVLDLSEKFWDLKVRMQVYLEQDTHWTPDAMKVAAEVISNHIKKAYPAAAPKSETTPLVDARVLDRSSYGDLVHLLDLRRPGASFRQEQAKLLSITGMDPDPKAPIALLGDSFVNVFDDPALGFADKPDDTHRLKAGLAYQLAIALNSPLDVIAKNGGGATEARREFARRYDDEVRTKKLVVWVIACRDLLLSPPAAREANVEWARVEFNPNRREGSTLRTPPTVTSSDSAAQVVVEATLVAKSTPQDPGATPYREALHTAVYKADKVIRGTFDPSSEWMTVQWTFKDKQLQPTASFQPGKRYRLTLVPWDSRPDLKSLNLSQDRTEDLFTADQWFVESAEEIP